MDEEIKEVEKETTIEDLKKEIEKESKIDFKELINQKIEADTNFEFEDLTEEEYKQLSEDEVKVFKIGRELYLDNENKLNLDWVIDKILSNTEKEEYEKDLEGLTDKEKEDLNKTLFENLKGSAILKAIDIYMRFYQKRFSEQIKDVMQRTYPEEILKHYFDMNNKEFSYDEDNNVIIHDEEETEFDYKRKEAYLESINLTKLLEYSKNKLFLNRLLKQCNNKRYFRHLDDFNYYIGRHVNKSMGTPNNKTNTADALPDLIEKIVFDRFTFDIYKLNEGNNYAISRAIVYFIADILKTTPLRDPGIYSIYFYNMNCVALSEIDKYDHLTGAAKRFYDNLVEFISNIYLYFKFQKK